MRISTQLAVAAMKAAESTPPTVGDPRYAQIFQHVDYVEGTEKYRRSIRFDSSRYRYDYETEHRPFERCFEGVADLVEDWSGTRLLDLGCLTGGRTAAWTDMYAPGEVFGFDIKDDYITAAREFAEEKGHSTQFEVAFAEEMPYPDDFFDVIASFDVIEHVADVEMTMSEALRVLRPGGRLYAVFPPYFNPFAAHLGLATRMHGLGLVFPGEVLAEAHHEVIRQRGPEHSWYNDPPVLPSFYKAPFLNGVTVRSFRSIVESQGWEIHAWPVTPVLSQGRRAEAPLFRTISRAVTPLARVPVLEEVFVGSVTAILRKP